METIFLNILNRSITAGWLVLAVLVLRLLLNKTPKWIRCVLWALVAVRLVCPVSIESLLSLIPSGETIPQEIFYAKEPAVHTGLAFANGAINPVLAETMAPNVGDSVNPMQVVFYVLSILWLIGIGGMLLYAAFSYWRVCTSVGEHIETEKQVWLCDRIDTPFILGLIRPRICMPSGLTERDREYVMKHERAHLRRFDHWWKMIGYVLLAVYWFHPLMWIAYSCLCRDIELACDETVLREMGSGWKKSYAEALLNCSVPRRMPAVCPLAFGEVAVKNRIKNILHYRKPAFWLVAAGLMACIVTALCFLTDPKSGEGLIGSESSSSVQTGETIQQEIDWKEAGKWMNRDEIKQHYCELNAENGLEVYVTQFGEGAYTCALVPAGSIVSDEDCWELWSMPFISVEDMKEVLDSYNLPSEQITFIPYQHPLSSYLWLVFEEGEDPERKLAEMSQMLRDIFGY